MLSEGLEPAGTDELAERLGLALGAMYRGHITRYAPHAITSGVGTLSYAAGSALTIAEGQEGDSDVEVLGCLDIHTPLQKDLCVMGVLHHSTARVFWMGDVNTLQHVPQRLVDDLVAWVLGP